MHNAIVNIIGGKAQIPAGSDVYKAINPSNTREIICEYNFSSSADVNAAVDTAAAAVNDWKKTSPIRRGEILTIAGGIIQERREQLARIASHEMGKPIAEAIAEVGYAGKVLQFYGAEAQRPNGDIHNSGRQNVHYYSQREPIGIVGAITPWNFPFSIACWKLGPALATGNTVVWKPAPHHPYSSQAIMEALIEAGIPEGVVNLIHGHSEVGSALVDHKDVKAISFTGSSRVGVDIYRKSSARLARAQCEMGGKNAVYVEKSADLPKAISLAIEGAFRSAGQKCTATSRILLDRSISCEFIEKFVASAKSLVVGPSLSTDSFLGPVVDECRFNSVRSYISDALTRHELLAGGLDIPCDNGYYISPTVFGGVSPCDTIAQEEIFGPVVSISIVDNINEAISAVNSTEYGLSSTICTRDLGAAHEFARLVDSGVVSVNLPTAGVEMHAPFGGWKGSGIGAPEQGLKILDFYTKWRSVAMQFC